MTRDTLTVDRHTAVARDTSTVRRQKPGRGRAAQPPASNHSGAPETLRDLALEITRWASQSDVDYLSSVDVPGASERELRSLSALGAVAGELYGEGPGALPDGVRDWINGAKTLMPVDFVSRIKDQKAHEILARAYELIVSGPNRRVLGTFFTPTPIVEHMVTLCEEVGGRPFTVIDPGAGVGAFSQAVLNRWPGTRVLAVDLNVVTLGLLAACVPVAQRDRLDLVCDNYLTWSVPVVNTSIGAGQTSDSPGYSRHATLSERECAGPLSVLTIGNPPYTRHQHLDAEDKRRAHSAAGDLVTSGLAGLSTYFAATAVRSLRPEDSVCLLLPGNWCQARYGRELREWLWAAKHREVRIQMFPAAAEVFPGTQVTAMVLYVGPDRGRLEPFWMEQLELTGPNAPRTGAGALDGIQASTVITVKRVLKDRAAECPASFRIADKHYDTRNVAVRLGDIARIRRGVATGANQFFFLSDQDRKELPDEVVKPALLKAAQLGGTRLDKTAHDCIGASGGRRWLLAIPEGYRAGGTLADYLRSGESKNFDKRHLTRVRPTWYCVESVEPPDLFFAPFARGKHRVIINEVSAIGSNNLYGVYLKPDCAWTATGLLRWFSRDENQALIASFSREYQGTSHKLEPGDLAALPLPVSAHRQAAKRQHPARPFGLT